MDDKENIIRSHYIDRVHNYDIPDYKVLDWESEDAQYKRFEIFVKNCAIEGKTILDVGSGLGNLAEYIDNKNIKLKFVGVDIMPEMTKRALEKKFNNIEASFLSGDIFNDNSLLENYSFDYIYSSGIFNLNLKNNKEFLASSLKYFFAVASEGVFFNLLDASCEKLYGEKYFYCDKSDIKTMLKSILDETGKKYSIKIIDGYLSNDFSVSVKF